jgi:phospholipase C
MANNSLPPIKNVVVLMLENRSFDNVLGTLYPRSPTFEGLPLDSSNKDAQGNTYTVANNSSPVIPPIDPGEAYMDMTLQIYGNTDGTGAQDMSGFVLDYLAQPNEFPAIPTTPATWYATLPRSVAHSDPAIYANAQDIMNYFTAAQMPVTWQLAKAFGVSDSWFGSSPTETFPNRLFLHCGTAGGFVDDYEYAEYILHNWSAPALPSVFELLDGGNDPNPANWKVYYHDVSGAVLLMDYVYKAWFWDYGNVCNFDANVLEFESVTRPTFQDDLNNGTLPTYSFIEPRYLNYSWNSPPLFANCNHPPNDVTYGEILLADVYNAIRASSYWQNGEIMLVVTYDEHGGTYDHVAPPTNATPPGGATLSTPPHYPYVYPFPDTRFGPRVPALLISPYVPAGTVFRPPNFVPNQANTAPPFDHTSVIATLRDLFGIGSLTQRDAAAPSLTPVLSLPANNLNNGPASVAPPSPPSLAAADLKKLPQHPTHLAKMHAVLREILRDKR